MQGGEQSSMIIVTTPRKNMSHFSWSRAVKLALHARMKLCFIGGSFEKPRKNDAYYEKWMRTNSMVQTWILNSISKDIVDAFLYTKTSRELWKELEERYVNKAFSMVLRVKKQRQVQVGTNETAYSVALHTKWINAGGFELKQDLAYRGNFKGKDGGIDKRSQHCTHCLKPGHKKENCFKLHGFPDWHEAGGNTNTNTNTPALTEATKELVNLMKGKIVQGKMPQDPLHVNFATGDFADDVLLTGTSLEALQVVKAYLHRLFTIKDLDFAKYFLGLELARSTHGTCVTQIKYLCDILVDCHMTEAEPTATPLPPGIKFEADAGPLLPHPDHYRCLVGQLLYLAFRVLIFPLLFSS
ncbi:UNVERIFIED_CONTAM: hypothetical protein Sangu_2870000 [Sesamum angustifolium]|uniref:Retrotransposon Copia-like N-terminal domain-containing protein n=1 Tax=Sesamum angustifolium TaxID=2727405 RepID=A0AAW2INZ3_9LAMI